MSKYQSVKPDKLSGRVDRSTLPRPFRRLEGRRLRGPVPIHFEEFYRTHLRHVPGARLKTLDVDRFYKAWAAANGAPSLNLRSLKRAMANIGHPAMSSNGMLYCDVAPAADYPGIPDNFPAELFPDAAHADEVVAKIENMITELSSIRAYVTKACPA